MGTQVTTVASVLGCGQPPFYRAGSPAPLQATENLPVSCAISRLTVAQAPREGAFKNNLIDWNGFLF